MAGNERTEGREDPDPATVEVVRNYLSSAANEMQRTLVRTAYNTVIYEILDFGLSIYDRDLNLVADSPGLALFLGANDFAVRKGIDHVGRENLEPGDVVLLNYPYWNSSHTLDVCVFAPVFCEGELVGVTASRAHWLDIGAKDEGYVLDSTDVHQEGIIFPGTKVYRAGEPVEDVLDVIRFNTRLPDKVMGDLNAQVAALRTGAERLRELHEKYGTDVVDTSVQRVIAHGERTARERIDDLPDGTWRATDTLDNDGITDDPVPMGVEVTVEGSSFTVDFSPSADAADGPINIPLGRTEAVCKFCLKTLTTPNESVNEGHFAPLTVTAPEGNLFNAQYPHPTFTQWPSTLVIEVVFQAIAQGMPERMPASSGGDLNSVMLFGEDEDTGQGFVEANNDAVGWGATSDRDGPNALMHVAQTMVRNIPIEVFETKAPVRFDRLELREDSGGAGKHRGGLGVRRDYRITDPVGLLSVVKKTRSEGWGLRGGAPGARNAVVLFPGDAPEFDDRITVFADNDHLYPDSEGRWVGMMRGQFEPGDVVSNRSGGGGGYGDPFERPPEAVREDVADGYVSREGAREEYGVAITEDGSIDDEATDRLRSN